MIEKYNYCDSCNITFTSDKCPYCGNRMITAVEIKQDFQNVKDSSSYSDYFYHFPLGLEDNNWDEEKYFYNKYYGDITQLAPEGLEYGYFEDADSEW